MERQRRLPDSLDSVELVLAVEEAVRSDPNVPAAAKEQVVRDRLERITRGGIDSGEDDLFASYVRKPEPRNPDGRRGAMAVPEEPAEG